MKQLFAVAVARKISVYEFGSFHRKLLLLDAVGSIAQEGGEINRSRGYCYKEYALCNRQSEKLQSNQHISPTLFPEGDEALTDMLPILLCEVCSRTVGVGKQCFAQL